MIAAGITYQNITRYEGKKMKAKEYLLKIEKNERLINNKQDELFRLRRLAESTTIDISKEAVKSSGVSDKIGNITARIVDLENEIISDSLRAIDDMNERISVIEQLEDATEYDIIYRRYVKHQTLQQITDELHYTYEWICKLHGKALSKIQQIIEKRQ